MYCAVRDARGSTPKHGVAPRLQDLKARYHRKGYRKRLIGGTSYKSTPGAAKTSDSQLERLHAPSTGGVAPGQVADLEAELAALDLELERLRAEEEDTPAVHDASCGPD